MKIAIPAVGRDLSEPVSPRFGRCDYFLLVDTETGHCEALANPARAALENAGGEAAQFAIDHGAEAVLAIMIGPYAQQTLQQAGVAIYEHEFENAGVALGRLEAGVLPSLTHEVRASGGTIVNTDYASLYKDHRQARLEHVAWLQDIEQLRAQNSQTLALLGQIDALIRKYDAALQAYKARMSTYEIETQLDEELIMQQERLEGSPVSKQLAALRQQVEEELTGLHESAKRYQLLSAPYAERVTPLLAAVHDLI